jgi:hypothetical protein
VPSTENEVNQFEANMIRILRGVVGRGSAEQSAQLMCRKHSVPRCLGRPAVELVKDALRKGVVQSLASVNWKQERSLSDGVVVKGRLWQRVQLTERELRFSRCSLNLLIWLTSKNVVQTETSPSNIDDTPTLADELLFYFIFENIHDTEIRKALLKQNWFQNSTLIWLCFPDEIAATKRLSEPDFGGWALPGRAWVLDALQPAIARHWITLERSKRTMSSCSKMRQIGKVQRSVLEALFFELEKTGRRDLARFVMRVAIQMLATAKASQPWHQRLKVEGLKLAERQDVYNLALVVLRNLDTLNKWQQNSRTVSFHDEEYAASQLWKSDWESWNGDRIMEQSRAVIEQLNPLNV